jgi:hypothetical protein
MENMIFFWLLLMVSNSSSTFSLLERLLGIKFYPIIWRLTRSDSLSYGGLGL